jgi:hypothetical protein
VATYAALEKSFAQTNPYTGYNNNLNHFGSYAEGNARGLWKSDGAHLNEIGWNIFARGNWDFLNRYAQLPALATVTSGSIGGSLLATGACATGTVTITGATNYNSFEVRPNASQWAAFGWRYSAYVTAANTVTVAVCSGPGTPNAGTYTVTMR